MFSKKQIKLITSILVVLFSLFAIILSDNSSKFVIPFKSDTKVENPEEIIGQDVQGSSASELSSLTEGEDLEESFSENSDNEENPDEVEQGGYQVVKVVDGDTLDVSINDKIERLRLIGIDTPETVDPRKSVQCFGKEASSKAKELLMGKRVSLEMDDTQGERDKYKRLLRYVFLPDGTNFNLFMIEEGYAHEYTYHLPYKYQAEFKNAQRSAMENQKGLWSPSTCPGNK